MVSPRRRGLWIVPLLALVAGAGAFFYFLKVVLIDDRPFPFPDTRHPPSASAETSLVLAPVWMSRVPCPRVPEDFPILADHPEATVRPLGGKAGWVRATLADARGRVRQTALVALAGSQWEWSGVLPAGAALETATGLLSNNVGLTFLLEIVDDRGVVRTLMEKTVIPRRHRAVRRWKSRWPRFLNAIASRAEHAEERWDRARWDLAAWSGRPVRLRFRAVSAPESIAGSVVGLWAVPVLRGSGADNRSWATGRRGKTNERMLLAVVRRAQGDAVRLEGVSDQVPPRLRQFLRESVVFPRCYTTSTDPVRAFADLWGVRRTGNPSSRPSWSLALRERGWRLTAAGPFEDNEMDILDAAGFDEILQIPRDGLESVATVAAVLEGEPRGQGRGGHLNLVYLRDLPSGRLAPARFWDMSLQRFPWPGRRWRQWKDLADQAYRDHYLGILLELGPESAGPMTAVVSLGGDSAGAIPVFWPATGRRGRLVSETPGRALRESEIRALFAVRGEGFPSTVLSGLPCSLRDVGPLLLETAGLAPRIDSLFARTEEAGARVVVEGDGAKALIIDGRYKYIRRSAAEDSSRRSGAAVVEDFDGEELFDLWADAGERRNLIRARRALLGRARQVLDETSPDPIDVRLAFRSSAAAPVVGVVSCSAGRIDEVRGTISVVRRGGYEFSFESTEAMGEVTFRTQPPSAPYLMRLTAGGRSLSNDRFRVSKLAWPLFEGVGVQWHDPTKFAWMDGWFEVPDVSSAPIAWLGRVARGPSRAGPWDRSELLIPLAPSPPVLSAPSASGAVPSAAVVSAPVQPPVDVSSGAVVAPALEAAP